MAGTSPTGSLPNTTSPGVDATIRRASIMRGGVRLEVHDTLHRCVLTLERAERLDVEHVSVQAARQRSPFAHEEPETTLIVADLVKPPPDRLVSSILANQSARR